MEEKENSTVFGMMFKSTRRRNGNTFWTACAGMILALLPYFVLGALGFFLRDKAPKLWIVCVCIGAMLFGPLQYGYIRFYNKLTTEGNANIFSVYDFWNMDNFVMVLFGGLLQAVCYIICFAIVIVPILILKSTTWAIVAACVAVVIMMLLIAFFSMVYFFIEHHHYASFGEAMRTCYVRMRRNRMSMMSYKVLFYVFFLIIAALTGLCGYKISQIFGTEREVWGIVFACIGIAFLFVVCVFMFTWYHSTNHLYFEQILDYNEKKMARLKAKEMAGKEEQVQEEQPKEEAVEQPKEEIIAPKKAQAKKATTATTKKATAPKKTTTAKKTTKVEEVKAEEPKTEVKLEAPKKTTVKKTTTAKTTTKTVTKSTAKKAEPKAEGIEPPKKATTKKTTK